MSMTPSRERVRDAVLRDGSSIRLRRSRPGDEPALLAFLSALALESRRMRFAGLVNDLTGLAKRWAEPDAGDCSLVGEAGGRIVAQGSFNRAGRDSAEVAFLVADEFQGRGIATLLLDELAARARDAGIPTFFAEVLPENARMLDVFRESGFPTRVRVEPGALIVEFPTELSDAARERFEQRERIAAAAAVDALLHPASVAVIGASRRRGTIGGELFHNLLRGAFPGPVYPVNPNADVVQSVAAYRSVLDVPGRVDLAVIVLPPPASIAAAEQCAARGVRSLVVVSPGFAEVGPEGAERQRELLAVCRRAGMRLVGPNCMGVMNLDPGVNLHATYASAMPLPGGVGFMSQSGSLGLAIIQRANRVGLGLSSFVSAGNKADLSGNDFLQYWEGDERTAVVALYLESLGNPRKFARIARRVGRSKPIIAVKSGRSAAGARATSSHTGALIGASDVTVDALFRQAGVIRTDTLSEFFDVASLLADQPLPAGRRVGILTNGGGPGILAVDACDADGLEVPPLPAEVRARLAEFLPPEAALGNPVDTIDGTPDSFARAIRVLADWDGMDALLVLFVPPLAGSDEDVAVAIRSAVEELPRPIPVVCVFMASEDGVSTLRAGRVRVPVYGFPEEAARALARAVQYAEWRRAPVGSVPRFDDVRPDEAAAMIASALARGGRPKGPERSHVADRSRGSAPAQGGERSRGSDPSSGAERSRWLDPDEVACLLECYGIPIAPWRLADTPEEAARVAAEVGWPVAVKGVATGILHKAEARAVTLAVPDAAGVEAAAHAIGEALDAAGRLEHRFLVQRMMPSGAEMLVGVVHDRVFGPGIACGAGGSAARLLRDVAVRITPLTDRDAAEMVRSLATFRLLEGFGGTAPADVAALEDTLLRVGAMVEAHPEVAEMDCNPLIVLEQGTVVVDARIRIELPSRD